jgi:hypothetical protein
MSVRPSTHQRSPGDPITFGDIPPEVVREAFVHLSKSDLAAVRLVCRGWNPTAQDVMMSRARVGHAEREKFACGLHLRRMVGFNAFPIKILELDQSHYGVICVIKLCYYVAPTLSSLRLDLKTFLITNYNEHFLILVESSAIFNWSASILNMDYTIKIRIPSRIFSLG